MRMCDLGRVSCIIPVRDRREFIGGAIRSVLSQRCDFPIEVVVVDDGSSDGTAMYVREIFPEVRIVVNEKGCGGPSLARNMGVEAATGDIFMFLDSDDIWLQGHVHRLMALLNRGYHVAYGITVTVDVVNDISFLIPAEGEAVQGRCFNDLLRWCSLVPSSVAVTRHAFYSVGGFGNMDFGEDWHFFLRLSRRFEFAFTPEIITRRLLHSGSLCASGGLKEKICTMLEGLCTVVAKGTSVEEDSAYDRFRQMASHAASEGDKWKTVQDWYVSMKRHGLV